MAGGLRIRVGDDDLKDLSRRLLGAGPAASKRLKEAGAKSTEGIIGEAQRLAAALGPGYARAAGTLRPVSGETVGIRLGDNTHPDAIGWEYGAGHDRPRRRRRGNVRGYNQFGIWRGNGQDAGYFLWPAIRDGQKQQAVLFEDALRDALHDTFGDPT